MDRVSDLISAKASLRVRCVNCGHAAYLTARFLKAKLGLHALVCSGKYACGRCNCTNVKLTAAADQLAEKRLSDMPYFGGVYKKYED